MKEGKLKLRHERMQNERKKGTTFPEFVCICGSLLAEIQIPPSTLRSLNAMLSPCRRTDATDNRCNMGSQLASICQITKRLP